jgi:TonB family protein
MLEVLVSSQPRRVVRSRWLSSALAMHAIVLAGLIEGTRATVEVPHVLVADTTLLFLPRLTPPPVLPPEAHRRTALPAGSGDGGSVVLTGAPPPKGFQVVVAPGDIPSTIPVINPNERPFDPRNYSGRGVEGGVAYGVVGGTGKVDPDAIPSGGDAIYTATIDDARFEPAVLISIPQPKYPPVLRDAGISGYVVIRFIVDTIGRVEQPSIKVILSTHDGFIEAARESVTAAVFHPARWGQRPVRQLAEQPIRFTALQ